MADNVADKFFSNKFGSSWDYAPENIKQQYRDALQYAPESLGSDAVEASKGYIPWYENALIAIQHGGSKYIDETLGALKSATEAESFNTYTPQQGKDTNAIISQTRKQSADEYTNSPLSKYLQSRYEESGREIYQPYKPDESSITSQAGYYAKEMLLGGIELASDPNQMLAFSAGGGLAGNMLFRGMELLGKTEAGALARIGTSAIEGSAGMVAGDSLYNTYSNVQKRDLEDSAISGLALGAGARVIGNMANKLLGKSNTVPTENAFSAMSTREKKETVQQAQEELNVGIKNNADTMTQQEADTTAIANQSRVADENSPIDINDLRNGIDAEIEVSKSVTPQEPSVSSLESRKKEFNQQRLEEENNPLNLNQNIVDSIKKNGGLTDYQKKVLGLTDKDIEPYLSEEQVKANEAKSANAEPMKEQVEAPTPIEKEKLKTAEEVKNEMQPTSKEEVSVEPTQEYEVNTEGMSKEDYANLSVENKFKETMALVNKMKDMSDKLKEVAKGISQKYVMSEIKNYLGEHPAFEDAMAIFKSKEPKFEPLNKPEVKKQTVSNPEMKELNDLAQHPYFEEHLNERANVESKDTKYAQKKAIGRQYNQNGEVVGGALFEPNYDARFGITKRDVNAIRNALKTNKMNKVAQDAMPKLKNDLELRTRESGSMYEYMQNKIHADKLFSNTERTLKEKLAQHLAEKADAYTVEGQRTIREATETLNRIGKERDAEIESGVDRQQAIKEVSDNISEITGADAEATAKKVESAYTTADDIFNCGA